MGIIAWITKPNKKIGWSFLGFVLAVVFGALSLYTEFWKQTSPFVKFELLSNTPVLDVREKLPDLEVLYQKQDIAKSAQTLSVLLVRVVNHGSANLLSMHYDSKAPIGLVLNGGKLIRAELSSTSNDYLSKAAGVTTQDLSVTFEPVILEPGQWFLVKLLVLHSASTQPSVSAHGKIAGMHSIPVVPPVPAGDKEGFWYGAFSGNAWTQFVRLGFYFIGAVLCIAAIFIPSTVISESITTKRRKTLVTHFKAFTKVPLDAADNFIFKGFIDAGLRYVERLTNVVADSDRLQKRVTDYMAMKDNPQLDDRDLLFSNGGHVPIQHRAYFFERYFIIEAMIKNKFIKEVEGRWIVVPQHLKVATSFIEYVEMVASADV